MVLSEPCTSFSFFKSDSMWHYTESIASEQVKTMLKDATPSKTKNPVAVMFNRTLGRMVFYYEQEFPSFIKTVTAGRTVAVTSDATTLHNKKLYCDTMNWIQKTDTEWTWVSAVTHVEEIEGPGVKQTAELIARSLKDQLSTCIANLNYITFITLDTCPINNKTEKRFPCLNHLLDLCIKSALKRTVFGHIFDTLFKRISVHFSKGKLRKLLFQKQQQDRIDHTNLRQMPPTKIPAYKDGTRWNVKMVVVRKCLTLIYEISEIGKDLKHEDHGVKDLGFDEAVVDEIVMMTDQILAQIKIYTVLSLVLTHLEKLTTVLQTRKHPIASVIVLW
eukprot:CAMPEP_0201560336 /NCGR_PEP_ID=MMETSP0173_2-20130828/78212_1 /ASSEMBLY_ACC=CAM_ASM_000268 /TAXON_ID=218659 /ORGANISM="Vexillifera sp., Strain DIVA3 564/2" /LENGTH=331 /DNA_ID=CAMNT_0047974781 /DNA_START=481 /DNA_END=1473 /DNA_ORIENTATION=+